MLRILFLTAAMAWAATGYGQATPNGSSNKPAKPSQMPQGESRSNGTSSAKTTEPAVGTSPKSKQQAADPALANSARMRAQRKSGQTVKRYPAPVSQKTGKPQE